ncbi:hypothetical protein [Amycolatopsis samaneae]|uniref:Uncharacterized protein n=1 Tax=Amycolatopsis samaneae TaxID=664691 RepID=A0ABW5GGH5_9PSEU
MRNPGHPLTRSVLRGTRVTAVLVAVPAALLLAAGGAALADDPEARVETSVVSFGLLGPVGVVAVALGIVGMALGVLRQRRKARAAAVAAAPEPTAVADAAVAGTDVTAMAEAVLAEADLAEVELAQADKPTRPALTPHRRP